MLKSAFAVPHAIKHAISTARPIILPPHEPQGRARLSPGRHSRNQRGRERCPQRAANVSRHSYNRELKTRTPCFRTAKSSRNGEILMYMYPARRAADAKWKRRARDRRALPLLGSGGFAKPIQKDLPSFDFAFPQDVLNRPGVIVKESLRGLFVFD